jgi:hypothetical protein
LTWSNGLRASTFLHLSVTFEEGDMSIARTTSRRNRCTPACRPSSSVAGAEPAYPGAAVPTRRKAIEMNPVEIVFEEHDEDAVVTDKAHCGTCVPEASDTPHCGNCHPEPEVTDKAHCGGCF